MTNEERRKRLSHHVVHDYVNLISAGEQIKLQPRPPLNSHVQYSFILQYRKFSDFFSNKRRRASKKGDIDILAKDFVSAKIRYSLPEWKKWDAHMNAHVFHINVLRTRNSRPWTGYTENVKMLAEFRREWKKFFDALPDVKKAEFREEIGLKRGSVDFGDLVLYSGEKEQVATV